MTLRQYLKSLPIPSLLTWDEVLSANIPPTYTKYGPGYFCNEVRKIGFNIEQSLVSNNFCLMTEEGESSSEEFIQNTPDLVHSYLKDNPDVVEFEIPFKHLQRIYQINPYALKPVLKKRYNINATIRQKPDKLRLEFFPPWDWKL